MNQPAISMDLMEFHPGADSKAILILFVAGHNEERLF